MPAVWTSPDGITWSRVPHDETVFGGESNQSMEEVVAGGPGLVVVGWNQVGDNVDAAVWTSADGTSWTRVPHDEAILGGEGGQKMTSLAQGDSGLVGSRIDRVDVVRRVRVVAGHRCRLGGVSSVDAGGVGVRGCWFLPTGRRFRVGTILRGWLGPHLMESPGQGSQTLPSWVERVIST